MAPWRVTHHIHVLEGAPLATSGSTRGSTSSRGDAALGGMGGSVGYGETAGIEQSVGTGECSAVGSTVVHAVGEHALTDRLAAPRSKTSVTDA